jgi:hypothetical protein
VGVGGWYLFSLFLILSVRRNIRSTIEMTGEVFLLSSLSSFLVSNPYFVV